MSDELEKLQQLALLRLKIALIRGESWAILSTLRGKDIESLIMNRELPEWRIKVVHMTKEEKEDADKKS